MQQLHKSTYRFYSKAKLTANTWSLTGKSLSKTAQETKLSLLLQHSWHLESNANITKWFIKCHFDFGIWRRSKNSHSEQMAVKYKIDCTKYFSTKIQISKSPSLIISEDIYTYCMNTVYFIVKGHQTPSLAAHITKLHLNKHHEMNNVLRVYVTVCFNSLPEESNHVIRANLSCKPSDEILVHSLSFSI